MNSVRRESFLVLSESSSGDAVTQFGEKFERNIIIQETCQIRDVEYRSMERFSTGRSSGAVNSWRRVRYDNNGTFLPPFYLFPIFNGSRHSILYINSPGGAHVVVVVVVVGDVVEVPRKRERSIVLFEPLFRSSVNLRNTISNEYAWWVSGKHWERERDRDREEPQKRTTYAAVYVCIAVLLGTYHSVWGNEKH